MNSLSLQYLHTPLSSVASGMHDVHLAVSVQSKQNESH